MFSYEVLVLFPSTTSRIRGDLDVRVPRRSARARASVRRWPWSSRRGRNVQVKLIKKGGRLVRHSRRLIFQLSEVSVPRRLFQGVLDRIGRLSPVIAKLREGTTTILPRGRALQGVGLSSMRFHPIGGGPKTTKTDKKHGSRRESHLLLDRPEIDWPCRTRISCHHLVWAAH